MYFGYAQRFVLDWTGLDEPGNLIVGRRALDLHRRQIPAQPLPMADKDQIFIRECDQMS